MIRWGIIGCGDVTEVKSGPAFNEAPNSKLVAVMRRNGALAEDYARRHGVPHWYDQADALLDHPGINAIYIATPPDSHETYALAAIRRGLPVYIEKPVALNALSANRIADAVSNSAVKAVVAHYRRRLPAFLFVKQLLAEGRIGRVNSVSLRLFKSSPQQNNGWRLNPAISGGGYFHDLAPHQLDILLDYFGPPLAADGLPGGADLRIPATVSGQARFEGDILFTGEWNFSAQHPDEQDECLISGSEGSIRFHFFRHFDKVTLHRGERAEYFSFENPIHIQAPMIAATVKYFLGEGPNPCAVSEALSGLQLMERFTAY
ncbi:Gfo/Idh/MocA family protein [Chitinophaga vietnamensis]|uniref:Gfo/Idh/MocA family protein n=1 Tax=Chitinophaga vietnamensis TaxID=2593957 RepID=UPI0011774A43|nr:Gfo/Idh/MocA family oxidoreductase [Chitinophaga vietnamensis]